MKKMRNKKAFTLIELLVVIAIIAALVSIMAVGLKKVKVIATNLRQKGEFHSMDIGLELFSSDFNRYPDSDPISDGTTEVCGAQRLGEALFGRDEQGFNPKSKWHPTLDLAAAAPHPGANTYTSLTKKDRMPKYMDLKHSGLYTIYELWAGDNGSSEIYDSGAAPPNGTYRAPVVTDVFLRNKVTLPNGDLEKVGMPVLYFKGDSTKRFRVDAANQPVTNPAETDYKNIWAYDFSDNLAVLQLPWLRDTAVDTDPDISPHFPDEDGNGYNYAQVFYEMISRPHTPGTNLSNPFNPNTFILISAGRDGIYGTDDDLTNFY